MLSKVLSSTVKGIDAHIIEVEIDIAYGLPVLYYSWTSRDRC